LLAGRRRSSKTRYLLPRWYRQRTSRPAGSRGAPLAFSCAATSRDLQVLLLLRKSGSEKSQNTNRARRGSRKRPDPPGELPLPGLGTTRACRREAALGVVRGAWSRAVWIAVSIAAIAVKAIRAVIAPRTVIAPPTPPWAPPTSVRPAYPRHALMQGDVARYGREIGHGHRLIARAFTGASLFFPNITPCSPPAPLQARATCRCPNSDVLAPERERVGPGLSVPVAPSSPLAPSPGGAFSLLQALSLKGTLPLTQRYLVSWEG
jgi:hypothetical protein